MGMKAASKRNTGLRQYKANAPNGPSSAISAPFSICESLRLDLHEIRLGLRRYGRIPSYRSSCGRFDLVDETADVQRSSGHLTDSYRACDLYGFNPMHGAANAAPALRAVWRSTKNARFHASLKVG